ncbi:MAG: hypothetical protein P4L41_04150 [Flavipsychrobacter sp.]|nr:hypothetical protein [Flavipsychrobacter sp.]
MTKKKKKLPAVYKLFGVVAVGIYVCAVGCVVISITIFRKMIPK